MKKRKPNTLVYTYYLERAKNITKINSSVLIAGGPGEAVSAKTLSGWTPSGNGSDNLNLKFYGSRSQNYCRKL